MRCMRQNPKNAVMHLGHEKAREPKQSAIGLGHCDLVDAAESLERLRGSFYAEEH